MAESRLVISIDARNAQTTAQNLNKELQNITNSGNAADRQVNVLGGSLRNLAGYMAGIVTVGAAINKMDAYTGINNKLKLVTNSQIELNQAMEDTFAIAQRSASAWSAVNDVYSKYMANAKTLNLTQAETAKLTEITSKAVAISGSNTESAAAALFQYGQALDGNILRAEEYNSLVDGAGGLLNAMAKGLNVTRGGLRQMMLDGKLTGEVITQALLKAGDSVDKLYEKTDITIGSSFVMLSDSITKFIGEASSGSGAASVLSGSIRTLAQNLELIASGMIVSAAFMAGTYIPAIYASVAAGVAKTKQLASQSLVQYALIQAEKAASAQEVISAETKLAGLIATKAQLIEELKLELARKKSQFSTQGAINSELRMGLLRQEQAAINAQLTATENILAAARTRSAAADTASIGTGRALLGILGGPVGIGVTVATIAAGYLLMRDNTNKATASIEYQGQKVDELVVKYRELNTLQRDNETKALAEQVQDLAVKFRVASSDLTSFIQALPASDEKIQFFEKLTKEYQNGKISSDAYYKSVKEVNFLTDEQLNKVRGLVGQYGEAKTKFGEAETAQKALAASTRKTTEDVKEQAIGVAKLTDKMKELLKTANQNIQDSKITTALASRGYNDTMIDLAKKYLAIDGAIVKNAQGQYKLREDLQKSLKAEYDAIVASKNAVDARNESEKVKTKELEKQQKVLQLSSKIQENASKYNFGGLESKYGLPAGMLSALHAIETGNTGKTNQVNKQSGATGGFQFLSGTAKQYGVQDRNNLAQSAEGAAKYMSYLLSLFKGDLEKAVRAYHAGEGNVQKNKNIGKYNNDYWSKFKGYTASANGFEAGDIGSKEFERMLEDATKLYEQQAQSRQAIELDVANNITKINLELQQKKEEVEKANFSPERKKEIIAEYESRAASDIAIANQALKTKLDEYAAFTKSEETLLRESFDQKKFYASQDIELSKDQKSQASSLLEKQYQEELALIKLAKEQRIFAAQESMMTEMEAVRNRYDLERKEIANIRDEKERAAIQEAKDKAYINLGVATGGSMLGSVQGRSTTPYKQEDVLTDEYNKQRVEMDLRYKQQQEAEKANAEALTKIHQDYLMAKGRLNSEYDEKVVIARENDSTNQLQNYSNMIAIAQGTFGQMTDMIKQAQGENSSAYKAMFLIQQGMAAAQAIIYANLASASALAPPPIGLGPVAGLPLSGMIKLNGYASAALIAAQTVAGFKTGGYTGSMGTSDVAGVVHGQEYVLNAAATKRVGTGTLDAINSGGSLGGEISVNIQNFGTSKEFDVQQIDENTVRIIARDETEKTVARQLASPNSPISKGIKNNFNTSNRRG